MSHRRKKHLLEYACQVCGRRFGYQTQLDTHMASHSTENVVMCHLCGKGFRCQKYLGKHLRFTHAQQNGYLCGQCGRSFKHLSSYEAHMKVKMVKIIALLRCTSMSYSLKYLTELEVLHKKTKVLLLNQFVHFSALILFFPLFKGKHDGMSQDAIKLPAP